MKKIALISAIALSGLFYNSANAQLRIGLGIHINTPAVRIVAESPAPVYTEYASDDQYYYLPEVDAYYSVPERVYYYNNGYNWVSAAYLPGEYRNYDWRNARHYEVRARRPYLNADVYRDRYRGRANDWSRYNNRSFDNRAYANRDFNRDDRRNNQPVFERRSEYRGEEHSQNRGGWNNGNRGEQRDNRQQGNGSWGRDNNQPQQNQPSRQNGNSGQHRGGSDDHFADRSQNGRGGFRS